MMQAGDALKAEALRDAVRETREREQRYQDPHMPGFKPKTKEVTGKAAEKIADAPRLTGNAEWDAVELAETDPLREPISDEFLGRPENGGRKA